MIGEQERNRDPWWWVEVNSRGEVTRCVRVPEAGQAEGRSVHFVQAPSAEAAKARALDLYREQARARTATRRAAHEAAGRCRCGEPREEDFRTCRHCRAKYAEWHDRSRKTKAGIPVPPKRKSVAIAETQARREARAKAELLELVREKFRQVSSVRIFGKWLDEQIQELRRQAG